MSFLRCCKRRRASGRRRSGAVEPRGRTEAQELAECSSTHMHEGPIEVFCYHFDATRDSFGLPLDRGSLGDVLAYHLVNPGMRFRHDPYGAGQHAGWFPMQNRHQRAFVLGFEHKLPMFKPACDLTDVDVPVHGQSPFWDIVTTLSSGGSIESVRARWRSMTWIAGTSRAMSYYKWCRLFVSCNACPSELRQIELVPRDSAEPDRHRLPYGVDGLLWLYQCTTSKRCVMFANTCEPGPCDMAPSSVVRTDACESPIACICLSVFYLHVRWFDDLLPTWHMTYPPVRRAYAEHRRPGRCYRVAETCPRHVNVPAWCRDRGSNRACGAFRFHDNIAHANVDTLPRSSIEECLAADAGWAVGQRERPPSDTKQWRGRAIVCVPDRSCERFHASRTVQGIATCSRTRDRSSSWRLAEEHYCVGQHVSCHPGWNLAGSLHQRRRIRPPCRPYTISKPAFAQGDGRRAG